MKFKHFPQNILFITNVATLVLLLLVIIFASSFAVYPNMEQSIDVVADDVWQFEAQQLTAVETQPKMVEELKIGGWIPDWDYADGVGFVRRNTQLSAVSPFWYEPNDDGSIKKLQELDVTSLTNLTDKSTTLLIPTVVNFDEARLSSILRDPENLSRHVEEIYRLVVDNNFDGIDLDYESIRLADKENYFRFLQELAEKLHDSDKILVVELVAKWSDLIHYGYLPQTRKVMDYGRIASIVDEVRIMTYDFIGRAPTKAGPLAPTSWMEDVIRYAIAQGVPRDKIMLGIHTYAYDWSERPLLTSDDLANWDTESGKYYGEDVEPARAYYYDDVEIVASRYDMKSVFNDEWGEYVGRYTKGTGEDRVVVYLGNKGIQLRKQLAANYGLKGVFYWRLGDEGGLEL